jgi:hypothetical protein
VEIHNGQQPITHRNLGNYQGKPNVGKPNKTERYYYFSSKKFKTTSITFFSQEKYLLQQKTIPCKSVLKIVPQSVQLYGFAESWHLEIRATTGSCTFSSVRPSSFRKFFKDRLKNCAQSFLSFRDSRMLLYGSVQYNLSQQITLQQIKTKNISLGFVP